MSSPHENERTLQVTRLQVSVGTRSLLSSIGRKSTSKWVSPIWPAGSAYEGTQSTGRGRRGPAARETEVTVGAGSTV